MASDTELAAKDTDLQQFVDHFLHRDRNGVGAYEEAIRRLKEAAVKHRRSPLVLPWLDKRSQHMTYYVVPREPRQLTSVRDLLVAFVGPSLAKYGYDVPAKLELPHEAPLLERYGSGRVFVVSATADHVERRRLRTALERMVDIVERSPQRAWSAPRPLGRLLADFEAALLSGAPKAAAQALRQIDAQGGLSPANLKHLEVRFLAAQGRAADLLSLAGLREILLQDPPILVKDMVLSALFTTRVEPALSTGDLAGAVQALGAHDSYFSLLADGDLRAHSDQAAVVLLLGMYGAGDPEELSRGIALLDAEGRGSIVPDVLSPYRQVAPKEPAPTTQPDPLSATEDEPVSEASRDAAALATWREVVQAVAAGNKDAFELCRRMDVRRSDASSPVEMASDAEMADVFAGLSDPEYEAVWQYALGPFLQELARSDLSYPQTLTTVMQSIVNQRCDQANLAVLDLLLELFLRAAPSAREYSEFLEQMAVSYDQWVAPETAGQALDFIDRLVAFAAPAPEARVQAAQVLLGRLCLHSQRLDPTYLATARSLTEELTLGLEWPEGPPPEEDEDAPVVGAAQILVYGLDEGVLQRVQKRVTQQYPDVKVVLSAEKVASKHLKEAARNSDFSVMITQCAAHAATSCIGQYAKEVVYPRGAGSASVTHAAVTALQELATKQQGATGGKG